ncbi:hypothetical protein F5B20DRAFT_540715 [Whalleya microplaca]|nr:hypothetical protein F5B20DRAFT_540715 [Whalleya microplaca]
MMMLDVCPIKSPNGHRSMFRLLFFCLVPTARVSPSPFLLLVAKKTHDDITTTTTASIPNIPKPQTCWYSCRLLTHVHLAEEE